MKYGFASVVAYFKRMIAQGHERSIKAKKNIIASFITRSISIIVSFALVPLTINYINPSRYGIWLTLSSIIGWFSFFDIGLSHGLRNKFAEAKAIGDDNRAQEYVSTTYAILTIIFFIVWIVFLFVNQFLDWSNILNIPVNMKQEVSALFLIVFTYFCLQFILKTISSVIIADQQPAKASMIDVFSQIFSLLFVFILTKTTQGSLVKMGIALCISPALVLIGANIFFFNKEFNRYRPVFSKVRFSYAKELFNIGVIFFIIQIAGIIQFETANVLIARNFGTIDVTAYNIVFKYFNILNMFFLIFITPFWSASTEAYLKRDFQWIKNGIKKYNILNLMLFAISLLFLIFSSTAYDLWLGKNTVDINWILSFWGFLYFNTLIFSSKYVYFLNGISALRIQFFASTISPVIYLITALLLIKYYGMGVSALFIASIIANFNGIILAPLQYHLIIYKNRSGIWIK